MAAELGGFLVGADDHRHRVPADDRPEPTLERGVARKLRLAIGGDRVVGKRHAGERIADRARQDPLPLERGRHDGLPRHALRQPRPLAVSEKERFATHDRTAEVATKVVLLVIGFGGMLTDREEIIGVEFVVPQVLVAGAVERIRT